MPTNLQRITTFTITNSDCRTRHSAQNQQRLFDNKICTLQPGVGTCFGDEGGALVANNVLIGISSWQVPCAQGFPDVYERISDKRLWIMSNIS